MATKSVTQTLKNTPFRAKRTLRSFIVGLRYSVWLRLLRSSSLFLTAGANLDKLVMTVPQKVFVKPFLKSKLINKLVLKLYKKLLKRIIWRSTPKTSMSSFTAFENHYNIRGTDLKPLNHKS